MTNMVRVAVAPGRRIMDPATLGKGAKKAKPIGEAGLTVDADSPFWHRRLRDGDVVIMTADQIKAADAKVEADRAKRRAAQEAEAKASAAQQKQMGGNAGVAAAGATAPAATPAPLAAEGGDKAAVPATAPAPTIAAAKGGN